MAPTKRVIMVAMRVKTALKTVLILGFVAAAKAQDNPLLSIRVLEKLNPGVLQLQCPAGKGVWNEVKLSRGQLWVNGKARKRTSWGTPDSTFKIKFENVTRIYPGAAEISAPSEKDGQKLLILNRVPLEDYAACVLAFESGFDKSQPEYLKALGAAVQLYALSHRHRHPGYDLCDLSHCQVYQGLPPNAPFWKGLIEAGKDYIPEHLPHANSYYFHRCCGGLLESPKDIWGATGGRPPVGQPSAEVEATSAVGTRSRVGPDQLKGETLCKADSFFNWTSSSEVKNFETALKETSPIPAGWHLKDLKVAEKTAHGRVKTLLAFFESPGGEAKEVQVNAQRFMSQFGKRYGWRVFPSARYEIEREGDLFRFRGRGFGHGVGFCQSGALRLAQLGWSWREILKFYFP